MKISDFKSGDKVKLIKMRNESRYYKEYLGNIYTIDKVYDNRGYVTLKEISTISPYYYNLEKVENIINTYDFSNAPDGTKLTLKNGDVLIKDGYDHYENEKIARYSDMLPRWNIIKIEEPEYHTIYECNPEILDKDDKRYIKSVIRPFKDRVKYITKRNSDLGREFISITLNDNFIINLPFFEKGTMYENMEADKLYTLEDLYI